MLDHIFGSPIRAGLISLVVQQPTMIWTTTSLAHQLQASPGVIKSEMSKLADWGLVIGNKSESKTLWHLNLEFPLLPELKSLIVKSLILLEKHLAKELASLRGAQLLLLTGVFIGEEMQTDILIVGTVDKNSVAKLVEKLSGQFHQQLRYTIMSRKEYLYRRSVTDKFLYQVLNLRPIVIVDKLVH